MKRLAWAGVLLAVSGCKLHSTADPNGGVGNGAACADSSKGAQSNCMEALSCLPISENNMCSYINCVSDSECGSSPTGVKNYCVTLTEVGVPGCVRGCDPSDTGTVDAGDGSDGGTALGPCGRTDFVCAKDSDSGHRWCIPDCRVQADDYCAYGTLCDATDAGTAGTCTSRSCTTTADCPSGSNTICASVDGHRRCVPDCLESSCPTGRTCNDQGGCDTIILSLNAACDTTSDACDTDAGLACVTTTASTCLQKCTSDSNCSAASGNQLAGSCVITDGTYDYCLVPCYSTYPTCPTGLTCQLDSVTNGYYCLP